MSEETKTPTCDCAVHVPPSSSSLSSSTSGIAVGSATASGSASAVSSSSSSSSSVVVDVTNIRAMKAYLSSVGVDFSDCFAKEDLQQRTRDTIAAQAALPPTARTSSTPTSTTPPTTTTSAAIIRSIAVGALSCNMTIIADPTTKHAVLCDPGGDPAKILALVREMDVKVVQIVVTHAHFDHFLAAGEVRTELKAPVYLHQDDLMLWRGLPMQCMMLGQKPPATPIADPDHFLIDNDTLKVLGGKCIHTPGHSPGSCCFYFAGAGTLLSGDTLFHQSIGRTDLLGGDFSAIQRSIREKLYCLPDATQVIPGHGASTSIGFEKKHNSVVRSLL